MLDSKWWISRFAPGKFSTHAFSTRYPKCRAKPSCRQGYRELAFADAPLPIGFGQSMLAPKIQGRILQALGVNGGDRALEVGTGTGYLSACLSLLSALTHSIDIHAEFTVSAAANLRAVPKARVQFETRDAFGPAPLGEYDVIAVTGSLPVYDTRFERALSHRRPAVRRSRLGARHGRDAGAPGGSERMDSREPIRDRHRASDQCNRRARIRILMIEELSPREFLERRAAGAEMTLLDVREDWEIKLAPGAFAQLAHSDGSNRGSTGGTQPPNDDGCHLPLRRPEPPSGAFPRRTGVQFGAEPRRRHFGVVSGRGPANTAVLK